MRRGSILADRTGGRGLRDDCSLDASGRGQRTAAPSLDKRDPKQCASPRRRRSTAVGAVRLQWHLTGIGKGGKVMLQPN